jgi:hypothetical protein
VFELVLHDPQKAGDFIEFIDEITKRPLAAKIISHGVPSFTTID